MADSLQQTPYFAARRQTLAATSHGARVMEPNPGGYPPPDHIYLIYLTQDAVHGWIVRHMFAPTDGNVDARAELLFDLAKANSATFRVGYNFVDLKWEGPCYLYLVLDLDESEFIQDGVPDNDPIQFRARKPILGSNPVVYNNYDANYSFYDGEFKDIRNRKAFRCVNYFKDETGDDIEYPQVRFYGFEIRFLAPYHIPGMSIVLKRPHDIDPDGQNQGPRTVALALDVVPDEALEQEARDLLAA